MNKLCSCTVNFLVFLQISLILKEHLELYDAVKVLTWMSNRAIVYDDIISSLKYHYICTVIQQAKKAGNTDDWMHKYVDQNRKYNEFFVIYVDFA